MPEDLETTVEALHALYQRESGFETLRLTPERQRGWLTFHKAGFTADELEITLRYLNKEIRADNRNPGAVKWSNLIGLAGASLDKFEEDCALAKKAGTLTKAQIMAAQLKRANTTSAYEEEQSPANPPITMSPNPQQPTPIPKDPGELSRMVAESLGHKA